MKWLGEDVTEEPESVPDAGRNESSFATDRPAWAERRDAGWVSVVSTLRSHPPMVADELPPMADEFIELTDLTPGIARPSQTEGRIPTPARSHLGDADRESAPSRGNRRPPIG